MCLCVASIYRTLLACGTYVSARVVYITINAHVPRITDNTAIATSFISIKCMYYFVRQIVPYDYLHGVD